MKSLSLIIAAAMLSAAACVAVPVLAETPVVTQEFTKFDSTSARADKLTAQVKEINDAFAKLPAVDAAGVFTSPLTVATTTNPRPLLWAHSAAATWGTPGAQYLMLGGAEYGVGTVRGIGFGYVAGATSLAPAFVGYQEASKTGNTNGDLFFATRGDTGAGVATERLRITAAGEITASGNGSLLSGVTSIIDADRTITTFRDGDLYLFTNRSPMKLTIPTAANAFKAGAPRGGAFYVQGYSLFPTTLVWGSNCFTPDKPSGYCPTSITYGESWMFKLDGAAWRAIRLNGAPTSTFGITATPYSIAKVSDGDYYSTTAKTDLIWNMATAANLQVLDGVRFDVASLQPSGHKITLNTGDKFTIPAPLTADGFTESTQLTIDAGERYTLIWNAGAKHWHVWKN